MTIPGMGGQVPPRPDQQYQGSSGQAVIGPGSTSGVIRARQVIVSGSDEGVFVYSGTPGPGNPPIDYMSNSATDPFGNVLPQAGTVAYVSPTVWSALTGGQLLFADGTTVASVNGNARFSTISGVSVVMNDTTGEIDLNPTTGRLLTGGNSITGLFGNLDPSGYPLSGSATLGAVIATLNSTIQRFVNMGVFL